MAKSKFMLGCQVFVLLALAVICVLGLGVWWLWNSDTEQTKQHRAFIAATTQPERQQLAEQLEQRVMRKLSALDAASVSGAPNSCRPGGDQAWSASASSAQPATASHDAARTESTDQAHGTGQAAPADTSTSPAGDAANHGRFNLDTIDTTPRKITVSVEEANAWLTERLDQVLASHGASMPHQITNPGVAIDGDKVVALFSITAEGVTQNVSAYLNIDMVPGDAGQPPRLKATLEGIKGGNLPLPRQRITKALQARADEARNKAMQKVQRLLDGNAMDAVFKFDGKRNLRLIDFEVGKDGVDLTLRTEPRKPNN